MGSTEPGATYRNLLLGMIKASMMAGKATYSETTVI